MLLLGSSPCWKCQLIEQVDTFNTVKTLWTFVDSSIAGGADPAAVRAAAAGAPPQPPPRRNSRLQADQGRDAARRHQGDPPDHPEAIQHLNPEPRRWNILIKEDCVRRYQLPTIYQDISNISNDGRTHESKPDQAKWDSHKQDPKSRISWNNEKYLAAWKLKMYNLNISSNLSDRCSG